MRYLAVLLLAAVAGLGGWLVLRPGRVEQPDILLVTIDTLRADTVGSEAGTPAIIGFLHEATRFSRTRTVAPLTLPAHTSILTGLIPANHGLHENITEPLPEKRPFPLLAEQFRDRGYETAAFLSSSTLGPDKGIAYGFDVYQCPAGEEPVLGGERVKAAIDYLRKPRTKPRFVWVHLWDPHAPCRPFAGDARRPATRAGADPRTLYVGGVRRADAAFESLIAAAGKAVVVLASDHGEAFAEHDELTHGALCYGETTDVLLAVRAPGFAPGAIDQNLRCLTDVAPTLRRICGLPDVPTDGIDLCGVPHETVVSESMMSFRVHGWGQCFAVSDGVHTLVESGPRLELFDRTRDPTETQSLELSHPAYEKLDRALERVRSSPTIKYEGALCESISAYGHLRMDVLGGYLPRAENAKLLDPRPRLLPWMRVEGVTWLVHTARTRKDKAPLESARRLVSEFEQVSGESPLLFLHRAQILEAMAEITGDNSTLLDASRARVRAAEKGHSSEEQIRSALRSAKAARDPESLQRLVAVVRSRGGRYSPQLVKELDDALAAVLASQPTFSSMR